MQNLPQRKLQIYQKQKQKKQYIPYYRIKQSESVSSFQNNPCIVSDQNWLKSRYPHHLKFGTYSKNGLSNFLDLQKCNKNIWKSAANNKMISYSQYCRQFVRKKYNHFVEVKSQEHYDQKQLTEMLNQKLGIVYINKIIPNKQNMSAPISPLQSRTEKDRKIQKFKKFIQQDIFQEQNHRNRNIKQSTCFLDANNLRNKTLRKSDKKTIFSSKNMKQSSFKIKHNAQIQKDVNLQPNIHKINWKMKKSGIDQINMQKKQSKTIPIHQWDVHDSLDVTHLQLKAKQEKQNVSKKL